MRFEVGATVGSDAVLCFSDSVDGSLEESGCKLCFFFLEGLAASGSTVSVSTVSELVFLDFLALDFSEGLSATLPDRTMGLATPVSRSTAAAASFSSWAFMRACLPERPPHLRGQHNKGQRCDGACACLVTASERARGSRQCVSMGRVGREWVGVWGGCSSDFSRSKTGQISSLQKILSLLQPKNPRRAERFRPNFDRNGQKQAENSDFIRLFWYSNQKTKHFA